MAPATVVKLDSRSSTGVLWSASRHLLVFLILCLLANAAAAVDYFVSVDHPNASDSNDGLSPDHPFKTLERGAQSLWPGDTLNIMAGVYREVLEVPRSGTETYPIVIRAYPGDEGHVVIRGSDLVTDWTNDGGTVWSMPWSALPPIVYPSGWPDYGEYSRRREMVFVEGVSLRQVLSEDEMESGCFWMDDAAGRIRLDHPGDPRTFQVEISVRNQGVTAVGSNIIFRGIRVEHVSSELTGAAMILGAHDRVEDCRVENNNGHGITALSELQLVRSTSSHNGRLGVGMNGSDSLVDASETSFNSWRYGPMWEAGGIKIAGNQPPTGNRILRHTARGNNGPGVWFDTVGSENVVESSVFDGNVLAGIDFEASAGPNFIVNNVILETAKTEANHWGFDGAGVLLYEVLDTRVYNNTIVGVSGSGIVIFGGQRGPYYCANTHVYSNIVVDSEVSAIFVGVSGLSREASIVASHHFDNNLYHDNTYVIVFPDVTTPYNLFFWPLSEWQQNRGEDLNSLDEEPRFVRPPVGDYSLSIESSAIDAGRPLVNVSSDITGRPRPADVGHDIGAYECPRAGGCGQIVRFDFEDGLLPS